MLQVLLIFFPNKPSSLKLKKVQKWKNGKMGKPSYFWQVTSKKAKWKP